MTEREDKSDNPYQAPTSNLADDSDGQQEWPRTAIKLAEQRDRTSFCAYTSALYLSVFSTMLLDTVLFGWSASLFGSMLFVTPVAYAMMLASSYPAGKLMVFIQRKGKTVSRFATRQLNELEKWYSKPITTTILVAWSSVLFLFVLLYLEEFRLPLFDLDSSEFGQRFSALLALPVMMPMTHMLVRRSQRKARELLEKMAESS